MKILLVTGRVAAPLIHKIVKNITQVDMKVLELPIPVAAMMTSEYLLRELPATRSMSTGRTSSLSPE